MAIAFPCAWQWQALLFFPNQLPRLLRMAGCTEMPHNHPFRGRETLVFPGGASSVVQTSKVSREGMIWGLNLKIKMPYMEPGIGQCVQCNNLDIEHIGLS